jgi:hypothetical protein
VSTCIHSAYRRRYICLLVEEATRQDYCTVDKILLIKMRNNIYISRRNVVGKNEKLLLYIVGGAILTVFAFAFIIAPYKSPSKEQGEEFLLKNKLKRRVRVLPSGLQYKVLSKNKYLDHNLERKPFISSKVRVKYTGKLVDNVIFDQNNNAVFEVSGVIKGWQEGLCLMSEGDVYEFYIPSHLAYGEKKRNSFIVENSALIFKIKLLEIITY